MPSKTDSRHRLEGGRGPSWESEAADRGLLGDTRGGERSVRTARDTISREVLLAKMLVAEKTPQDVHIADVV